MPEQTLTPDPLEAELVALGRTLVVDPPSVDFADRVLTRIAETDDTYAVAPVGSPGSPTVVPRARLSSWLGSLRAPRRRAVAVAIAALLVVVLVPPVRAAVLEFFRIGGVTVREVPPPSGASVSNGVVPPAASDAVVGTLTEASNRVGFGVKVPPQLGPPTTIAVTREARVVELTWGTGATSTRLDVFNGSLSFGYLKSVWEAVTPTEVQGRDAVWFASPHLIQWTDRAGVTVSSPPRVAGPTLVWVDRDEAGREITYRLEGPATLGAAKAMAESVP